MFNNLITVYIFLMLTSHAFDGTISVKKARAPWAREFFPSDPVALFGAVVARVARLRSRSIVRRTAKRPRDRWSSQKSLPSRRNPPRDRKRDPNRLPSIIIYIHAYTRIHSIYLLIISALSERHVYRRPFDRSAPPTRLKSLN